MDRWTSCFSQKCVHQLFTLAAGLRFVQWLGDNLVFTPNQGVSPDSDIYLSSTNFSWTLTTSLSVLSFHHFGWDGLNFVNIVPSVTLVSCLQSASIFPSMQTLQFATRKQEWHFDKKRSQQHHCIWVWFFQINLKQDCCLFSNVLQKKFCFQPNTNPLIFVRQPKSKGASTWLDFDMSKQSVVKTICSLTKYTPWFGKEILTWPPPFSTFSNTWGNIGSNLLWSASRTLSGAQTRTQNLWESNHFSGAQSRTHINPQKCWQAWTRKTSHQFTHQVAMVTMELPIGWSQVRPLGQRVPTKLRGLPGWHPLPQVWCPHPREYMVPKKFSKF